MYAKEIFAHWIGVVVLAEWETKKINNWFQCWIKICAWISVIIFCSGRFLFILRYFRVANESKSIIPNNLFWNFPKRLMILIFCTHALNVRLGRQTSLFFHRSYSVTQHLCYSHNTSSPSIVNRHWFLLTSLLTRLSWFILGVFSQILSCKHRKGKKTVGFVQLN